MLVGRGQLDALDDEINPLVQGGAYEQDLRADKGQHHRVFRRANESVLHSLDYAYGHRRERKGDFRKLWIARINAAARLNGTTYNRLMDGLKKAGIAIDRKVLADLAITQPAAFTALADKAKA